MLISKGDSVTVSGLFAVMLTMGETEREREGFMPGQMSSLLKQGYPHYHVSAADATTQSSKTREERVGANRVCRETPLLKDNMVQGLSMWERF